MDPLNEFQSKEAEKLTGWVSQVLALKEARVFTTDSMAAVGQRSQVSTEVFEIADSPTPPVPVSESKASSIPSGSDVDLSDYYTKGEIDEKFEDYYTIGEIDEKFEDYYTIGEIDGKLEDYYTKGEVDSLLDNLATKDYVRSEISKLEDSIKAWAESNFVKHSEFDDKWFKTFDGMWDAELENILKAAQTQVDDAIGKLSISAECESGNVTVTLNTG
jgi:hypothetical protein